uniref:Uncharacterized protein n=1 Tax=Equus asinus TaxID=9793 RepID=A0A9L0IF06_EQUAS
MLATPCPVLHEALAKWHPPPLPQSSWLLWLPPPRSCPQELWEDAQLFSVLHGSGGPLRAWLPWVHLSCLATAPSIAPAPCDPRTRGAALPVSWTKHKGMSCLA